MEKIRVISRGNIGRIILAVVVGYLANGVLVAATEHLLSLRGEAMQPLHYFVVDLISQCVYTIVGGFLCCAVAGPTHRAALAGLIGLGVLVGTMFLVASWKAEPHEYSAATHAHPCVPELKPIKQMAISIVPRRQLAKLFGWKTKRWG